jgi:hypothetical protein
LLTNIRLGWKWLTVIHIKFITSYGIKSFIGTGE